MTFEAQKFKFSRPKASKLVKICISGFFLMRQFAHCALVTKPFEYFSGRRIEKRHFSGSGQQTRHRRSNDSYRGSSSLRPRGTEESHVPNIQSKRHQRRRIRRVHGMAIQCLAKQEMIFFMKIKMMMHSLFFYQACVKYTRVDLTYYVHVILPLIYFP